MYFNINTIKAIITSLLMLLFLAFSTDAKAQLTTNTVYGNFLDCDTMSRSIYLVWWDNDFDMSSEVDVLLDSMISYRDICLNELDMMDPPNPIDGYFYNVYLHNPSNTNDIFYQYGWGNGQGTDSNGYPFLTLPTGLANDWENTCHETFHVFQYNANAPGFSYSGDSQWYIEASANWFSGVENIDAPRAFVEAESLVRMSHVPLWLSYGNYPSTYPSNWQRYVHQYALALLLYYLTEEADVPDSIITSGLFSGTEELPQEYFYNQIGGGAFRNHFIDWAAHMTNNFDFILPIQASTNEDEWNTYADPLDDNEFIQTYNNSGSNGWYQPDESEVTNAWSFNTYKLLNSNTETYTFEINGATAGTYGDSSYFQGKVLVINSLSGTSFHDLEMSNDYQGSLTLSLSPNDTEIYFIVASMPEIFEDSNPTFQLFPYEMRISLGTPSDITESEDFTSKSELFRYNLLGQKVEKSESGVQIILYDDGSREKIYSKGE
jgi:hypothetical protein